MTTLRTIKNKKIQTLTLALALTSLFGGGARAAEVYFYGSDLANDTTAWNAATQTATLHADRSIGKVFTYNSWMQSHPDTEAHFTSLISVYSYAVAGAKGTEKLTLTGDMAAAYANHLAVRNLDTLEITKGTFGLDSTYGNGDGTGAGIYIDHVKNVSISGTAGTIYGDINAKTELKDIDTLTLESDINHKDEYGNYYNGDAEIDNTIFAGYGSRVDISAKNMVLSARGRAIAASAASVENINISEGSWETATPFPVVNVISDRLTINAATQKNSSAAVFSHLGAEVNLGSKEHRITDLVFGRNEAAGTYANMDLYAATPVYEDKAATRNDRYSSTIAEGRSADDYIKYRSVINVYAENAEFNANTNALNARNDSLINVDARKAVIKSRYGNAATINSSGNSTVTVTGDDITVVNQNTHYLKDGEAVAAEKPRTAISAGGTVNPSRKDLLPDYGGTDDPAGDVVIRAAKKLRIDGNIIADSTPARAGGNSVAINKDNTSALVDVTGDIYTSGNNEVVLTLGDGSAAREAGASSLTGAIRDDASAKPGFAFDDTTFSEKGTQLTMKDARWNVTGDSEVSAVHMDGRSVLDMTQSEGFQKVKIDQLTGTGTIKMDYDDKKSSTDGSSADKLFINSHSGTHYLLLHEANGTPQLTGNAKGTVLASVVSENGRFLAASDDRLTWNTYELDRKASSTAGYTVDWFLKDKSRVTPVPQVPTRSEAAAMQSYNTSYYLWRDQSERLSKRLGMACFDEDREGIWTRLSDSSLSSDGIFGSDTRVKRYTIGYDFKHDSDEKPAEPGSRQTRDFSGLAFTYTKGRSGMDSFAVGGDLRTAGGRGDIRGSALTAYRTHIARTGAYSDFTLRYSTFKNDFKYDGAEGSAKSYGIQAGAEYGYRLENAEGFFVTPNAQLTLGRLYNRAFDTSAGVHVAPGHLNSAVLRLGIDAGRRLTDSSQIYAKVSYNKEFGDKTAAMFSQDGAAAFLCGGSNSTWWEYGLGVDYKVGHASHLYMDIERASGSNFQKNHSWRIGARFDF